jgi:Flp pilus assembly pilin Flp
MKLIQAVQTMRSRVLHDSGQDLLEYGLLMALIAVVAIAGVTSLGNTIDTVFWEAIADFL